MVEWLNNPWVVGIGGGILSGIIVTFISRGLLSKRDNREYVQKLISANHEVIYAIRPGISEGVVPSRQVVEALIQASSRKYGVDRKDVHGPHEIAQELVKEVMDSSFISPETKEEYCGSLVRLTEEVRPALREAGAEEAGFAKTAPSLLDYRARTVSLMSMTMGVVTAGMTALMVFVQVRERIEPLGVELHSENLWAILPALLTLLAVASMSVLSMLYREVVRKKRDERAGDFDSIDSHPRSRENE